MMTYHFDTNTQNPELNEKLNFEDLTLFTRTFYGDDPSSRLRQELALELFGHAYNDGVCIVVSDGGSNSDFLEATAAYPNVTVLQEPEGSTMGSSTRLALEQAISDAKDDPDHIFMWLEPEKVELVDHDKLAQLVQPIRDGQADIVVPSRKNLDTLPKQQAWIEMRANRRANNLMRKNADDLGSVLDLWFGPKIFNRKAAQYFTDYRGRLDKWDAIIKPVLNAHSDRLRVADIPVDFDYPSSQSKHEDRNPDFQRKRLQQYGSVLVELGDPFWQTHELVDGALRSIVPRSERASTAPK